MNKNSTWKVAVLGAGLALVTALVPAAAQQQDPTNTRRGDTQKPVLNTYDTRPAPQYQDVDAATYEKSPDPQGKEQGQDAATYEKQPDPSGRNQDLPATRYEEENEANGKEVSQVVETRKPVVETGKEVPEARPEVQPAQPEVEPGIGEPKRGDSQKGTLPTYNSVPPSQGIKDQPAQNDVSNVEGKPGIGDKQKPVVNSYDKRPDPKGEAQKLDATRYNEQNVDNDGQPGQLQMRVIEGSVQE